MRTGLYRYGLCVLRGCAKFAAAQFPELQRLVPTRADQRIALWSKSHTPNARVVAFQRAQQFAAVRLPKLNRSVVTRGGQSGTSRIKSQTIDILSMAFECTQ